MENMQFFISFIFRYLRVMRENVCLKANCYICMQISEYVWGIRLCMGQACQDRGHLRPPRSSARETPGPTVPLRAVPVYDDDIQQVC